MDCSECHVRVHEGSVVLQRPGHEQCLSCHQDDFQIKPDAEVCKVCHASFPPIGSEDLLSYPRFAKDHVILFRFSHAQHVDKQARVDPNTGFRADCTFCHKFEGDGIFAGFPGHVECAACHSKPNIWPRLTAQSTTSDCQHCHGATEQDNPGFIKKRRLTGPHQVSGVAVNLRFSHLPHLRKSEEALFSCVTCHREIVQSRSLADRNHLQMLDCLVCHDGQQELVPHFRITDCQACHIDHQTGAIPVSHTRNVKPLSHTESFRRNHQDEASAANAKCFVCHTNVSASVRRGGDCATCHQVMRPVSHTARWRDTIHGKHAALDRQACAVCHTADSCSRCHNQLPRSHLPLGLFKAGAHADLATLELRSCFTCHTFESTCSACHVR